MNLWHFLLSFGFANILKRGREKKKSQELQEINKGRDKKNKKWLVTKRVEHWRQPIQSLGCIGPIWLRQVKVNGAVLPVLRAEAAAGCHWSITRPNPVGKQQQILRFPLTVTHNYFLHRLGSVSSGWRGPSHLQSWPPLNRCDVTSDYTGWRHTSSHAQLPPSYSHLFQTIKFRALEKL